MSKALLVTVWGNACFYGFAIFAPNHGLSIGANQMGDGNLAGALAYVPAMIAAVAIVLALMTVIRGTRRP